MDRRAANHVTQAANHASCCRGVVGEQPQNALQDVQSNGLGFPADGYFKRALALQVARRSRVATSRTCFRSPPRACGRILGAACTGGNNLRWWAMAGCREPPNARGMASTAYSTGTSLRARVSPTRASRAPRACLYQPFARKGQLPDANSSTLPLAVCPMQIADESDLFTGRALQYAPRAHAFDQPFRTRGAIACHASGQLCKYSCPSLCTWVHVRARCRCLTILQKARFGGEAGVMLV
eukprot:COSAG06_NODE_92_length_24690_cov_4.684071_4_plen_239_part_00